MAKKIFRLHEGGITEETGWFKSGIITSDHLNTIKTDGKDVASSIPTPFATIDLVKSAFRWVSGNSINGDTAHHKLVSDALDVAQLFYLSPRFSEDIRIVAWNPNDRFHDLKNSNIVVHQKYAETLSLFWSQDSVAYENIDNEVIYNFEKTERLYFILNKDNNNIIGGTSPATLFFAAPDVRKVTRSLNIQIGKDKLFDDEFASLPERESSFIEYIYTMSKQSSFAHYFPELYEYLEKSKNHLNTELKRKITEIGANKLYEYNPCTVLENGNDICEVLGIQLGVQDTDTRSISAESDFVIKSDYPSSGLQPLVLPQYPFSKTPQWTYTTRGIYWDKNTRIPSKNTNPPEESRLPVQNDSYFWLTKDNFFEDKIIELPYQIDDSKFITCGSKKHLLPLSLTFFKYYRPEDVHRYLTLKERAGGNIDAELKIPVKGGTIIFKKKYSAADNNIEKLKVHFAIFPFLKSDRFDITYNVGLLDDRSDKSDELGLIAMKDGSRQLINNPIIRNPGDGGELLSKYYRVENQPNIFGISFATTCGVIIPIMSNCTGNANVKFAIDFGTTNTHVEYKLGDNESIPFANKIETTLIQSLINRNIDSIDPIYFNNERTFEQEILPFNLSNEHRLNFPLRTALVHNREVDFTSRVDIMRQVNNYLLYEKAPVPNYLELNTQLKWSNYADVADEKKIESYIEFLITLVYYKTLQLGSNPSNTTVTWFYPVSMDEGELNVFFRLWNDVYERVFKQDSFEKIIGIPESIAPYLYYKSEVAGLSLSIDIGGGSSDIAVFDEDDRNPKLISSFKFAGNSIFGDGYPSDEYRKNSDKNGFVKTFKGAVLNAIESTSVNNSRQLKGILDEILEIRKNSSDFSSFLFSFEKDNYSEFSYTRLLQKNKKLKLSILVFYGAIAYYSSNLLKKTGVGIPKYILLSGTASKSASIIDASEGLNNLSSLFSFIFESVFGEELREKLQTKLSSIPKEVTCKGALKAQIYDSIKESPIKFWVGGTQDDSWGKALDREVDTKDTPKYKDLSEMEKLQIKESISDFYSILDNYFETINIESKYIIEPEAYDVFKKVREVNIDDYLTRGIKAYFKNPESKIQETLFFYPLIGILNNLSYELAENKMSDE